MRFDITTCTSRRNSHVEIDQSLPHPAIRRSAFESCKCNVQSLIAGSSKLIEREKMRFDISTCTSRRNLHAEIDQSLPRPAIRRSVLLSGNEQVQILIAGSSKLLERKKMRFDISTCTSRRNSHVEIEQSLPHPAIRRSELLYRVNLNVQRLIAGSSKQLEGQKMRFDITTCTFKRN